MHTAQKFVNARASGASTKVSSLYPITMIVILICLQRINALRAAVRVALEDGEHEDEEEDDEEDVDDRPSDKPRDRKPRDDDSDDEGAALGSGLNAKQRAGVAAYNSLMELLKS